MTKRLLVFAAVLLGGALGLAPTVHAVTTASVAGTTLTVNGDAVANDIRVRLPGSDGIIPDETGRLDPPNLMDPYYVEDPAGVTASPSCPADPAAPTTRLVCTRNGTAYGSFTVRINGLEGSDYIRAARPDQVTYDTVVISGGDGDDALFGSQTPDYLNGDGGNDLADGGAGSDLITGGTFEVMLPSPEGGIAQPASYGGAGAGHDRLYGGSYDDQITDGDNDASAPQPGVATAQLNDDIVDGGVCAAPNGPGEAMPVGRPATAPAVCPVLDNNIDRPEDHDAYMLGHRTRPLTIDITIPTPTQGAAGENEQIRRIEAVWAGSGDDFLYGRDGDLGDESLRGNGGDDRLEARGGDDELLGGDGQDTLLGGPGADIMWPGGHIISAPGASTEMVSDGPDYVDGSANSTIVGGHSMSDLVSYDLRTDNLVIDMTKPNTLGAPGENDTIVGVEDIMGGYRDDVIIGDAGVNVISGDPLPPVFNVLPDPPAYPFAPGSHAGNDHITTQDSVSDTVDCTGGATDVHVRDELDASVNCEGGGPVPLTSAPPETHTSNPDRAPNPVTTPKPTTRARTMPRFVPYFQTRAARKGPRLGQLGGVQRLGGLPDKTTVHVRCVRACRHAIKFAIRRTGPTRRTGRRFRRPWNLGERTIVEIAAVKTGYVGRWYRFKFRRSSPYAVVAFRIEAGCLTSGLPLKRAGCP